MDLKNLKDEYKKVKDEFISLKEKNNIFNKECEEIEKKK